MTRNKRDAVKLMQRIGIEYAAKDKPARDHIKEEQERRAKKKHPQEVGTPDGRKDNKSLT